MKISKFGEIVKSLRKKKNLTVAQLSALSGVPFHVLGTIERGENWPSSQWLSQLSQALGVPISRLFEEEGTLKPFFHTRDKTNFTRQFKSDVEEILKLCEKLETLCSLNPGPGFPLKITFSKKNEPFLIEEAAFQTRELLGIRELTGFDLLHLLEDYGLKILVCLFSKEQKPFSCFHPGLNVPVFFLNSRNSPEEKFVSLAYELGYQIFKKEETSASNIFPASEKDPLEEACEHFASCFLIPEKKLKKTLEQTGIHPRLLDYDLLLHLKKRFVVPATLFISRLWELELISKKQKDLFLSLLKPEAASFSEPFPTPMRLNENQRLKELILISGKMDSHREEIMLIETKLKTLGVAL